MEFCVRHQLLTSRVLYAPDILQVIAIHQHSYTHMKKINVYEPIVNPAEMFRLVYANIFTEFY